MLKRLLISVRQWFRPIDNTQYKQTVQDNEINVKRRNFFKKAAVGAASVSGTAGLATAVVDSMPKPDLKDKYQKDAIAGEQELQNRDYVVMSDKEKEDIVQSFIDSNSDQI